MAHAAIVDRREARFAGEARHWSGRIVRAEGAIDPRSRMVNVVARVEDPNFGLLIPDQVPEVPADVLRPRETWQDGSAYDTVASDLRGMFENNFKQFEGHVSEDVKKAGIYAA